MKLLKQWKEGINEASRPADQDHPGSGAGGGSDEGPAPVGSPCPTCAVSEPHPDRVTCPELIETVTSSVPILAKREALINTESFVEPFLSITRHHNAYGKSRQVSFGVLAKSVCTGASSYTYGYNDGQPFHGQGEAPHVKCSCGFYGIPRDDPNMYSYINSVTLLVELYGRIIEHSPTMYRAEWQKVVECQTPPCSYCGRASDHLLLSSDNAPERFVCRKHRTTLSTGWLYLDLDDLAHRLGVPVTRLTY